MAELQSSSAAYVCDLVRRRSAIALDLSKTYLIEARLQPLARTQGCPTLDALVDAARGGRADVQAAIVEAMTTNETSFFRDVGPFDFLRREVLPPLLAARARERRLTLWSAACSTGQEAYSIAMLLEDHFPELAQWDVAVLGTDLSERAVAKASSGRYDQLEINRGLPARSLAKHFVRRELAWEIAPGIRARTRFFHANLLDGWALGRRPDVVFLRNVLIYFEDATKQRILARLRTTLAPDGALFLGAAETTLNLDDGWERASTDRFSAFRIRTAPGGRAP